MAEKYSVRTIVLLEPEMHEAVSNWRWTKRLSSNGEAVRDLIRRGLVAGLEAERQNDPSTTKEPASDKLTGS